MPPIVKAANRSRHPRLCQTKRRSWRSYFWVFEPLWKLRSRKFNDTRTKSGILIFPLVLLLCARCSFSGMVPILFPRSGSAWIRICVFSMLLSFGYWVRLTKKLVTSLYKHSAMRYPPLPFSPPFPRCESLVCTISLGYIHLFSLCVQRSELARFSEECQWL